MEESGEIIKSIIYNNIKEKYEEFTQENKILKIKEENLVENLNNLYNNNVKKLKVEIRNKLKTFYGDKYNSNIAEQMILEIFQNKEENLKKVIQEIKLIQEKNFLEIEVPIIDGSLNLNIGINNNFVIINMCNSKNINNPEYLEIYNKINKFKFLYSINGIILEEKDNNIEIIKNEIKNRSTVLIGAYYLKKNNEI